MQNSTDSNNAYYHRLIQAYKNHIIALATTLILVAGLWELHIYREKQAQEHVQQTYETFLNTKDYSLVNQLQKQHPKRIQSHLASLYKAKEQFASEEHLECIETLNWIASQDPIPAIKGIINIRLANAYIEINEPEKALYQLQADTDPLLSLTAVEAGADLSQYADKLSHSDDLQLQMLTQFLQYEEAS